MSVIPTEILAQHTAVLGKTGSGKTSTAKLLIEQVVAGGARVCILDPIKSDWWGLTSSRDGKRAGLPFHILGGPRGHVPLHASAGKVVGEIVASGALPLSIIDMADFEPGGQAKFFTEFAPTLLRKMRGVVYLVIEEAHLFAPKERSGIGAENLSIHWAKTLATAGRSKGVRLVLVTQRTQALHNALLGSCDTMIAHRLTAPADQEPVVKWLKANTSKDVLEQVASSLASLKTGDAWLCSGEAKRFEIIHFPRIATYDNTATPTGDGDLREIKTAPVDQDKLRAIIGDAVEKAKADDPRELRKQIADMKRELEGIKIANPGIEQTAKRIKEPEKVISVLTDADRALLEKVGQKLASVHDALQRQPSLEPFETAVFSLLSKGIAGLQADHARQTAAFVNVLESKGFEKILNKLATMPASTHITPTANATPGSPLARRVDPAPSTSRPARQVSLSQTGAGDNAQTRILAVIKQYPRANAKRIGALAGVSPRLSTFRMAIGKLRGADLIDGDRDGYRLTPLGEQAAADIPPPPTGPGAIAQWQRELGAGAPRQIFDALVHERGGVLSALDLQRVTGIDPSVSTFRVAIGKLRNLELIDGTRAGFRANLELFS